MTVFFLHLYEGNGTHVLLSESSERIAHGRFYARGKDRSSQFFWFIYLFTSYISPHFRFSSFDVYFKTDDYNSYMTNIAPFEDVTFDLFTEVFHHQFQSSRIAIWTRRNKWFRSYWKYTSIISFQFLLEFIALGCYSCFSDQKILNIIKFSQSQNKSDKRSFFITYGMN